MEIVFESEAWVAVDKPAQTLSVPGRFGDDGRPVLGRLLEERLGLRLWPVHRLDFEVSGLVLFAKNAPAHARANAWFEGRSVAKTYEAWVAAGESGAEAAAGGGEERIWRSRLLRGKKRAYEHAEGKAAETRALPGTSVLWRGESYLRWTLHPLTGRAHQLRYEMAKHAGPIAGDALYGSKREWPGGGIALRAVALDLSSVPEADRLGLPASLRVAGLGS
jgi:tRNA pseudouridine32 synthase/23S rRNA pseudouridine746 synthase